jgi:hypothetical protein
MFTPLRLALVVIGLMVSAQALAATELVRVRGGVGVIGGAVQLTGTLDVNSNGRPEVLVGAPSRVSFVEEDLESPRGYREVAWIDAPGEMSFSGAMRVDVPGEATALLMQWSQQLELRDAATLRVKARLTGNFGKTTLGDVDGDGALEIVIGNDYAVKLLDPITLATRGDLALLVENIAVANIIGDARAEIISNEGRAYTVTRSGSNWSATEVWNAGLTGDWNPYVIDYEGHPAIVLHGFFSYEAQLATFSPTPSLRTLVPRTTGPEFRPVLADVNGDGRVDLITATSHELRALDITSGATLWQRDTIYEAPYIGSVYSPMAVDVNADGIVELVWSTGGNNGGVVAMSLPPTGAPRWRSDENQPRINDWTLVKQADGGRSIAYLTSWTQTMPRLHSIGFLDASTFTDQGGSALAWLPGYTGLDTTIQQHAIAAISLDGLVDATIVAGAEYPNSGGNPTAKWLWTFAESGALLNTRSLNSSITPEQMVAAQVLNGPERQIVIAGRLPRPAVGQSTTSMRVEIVDYATGNVLWQSAQLPTAYDGMNTTKLEVADLDADGQQEIVIAYGGRVAILKPSASQSVIAEYAGQTFSLTQRTVDQSGKVATVDEVNVAVYDGLSAIPEKTFVLPNSATCIALFRQTPSGDLMFATSGYYGTTVRRYADGGVAVTKANFLNLALSAMDIDGDHQIELIGSDLNIWRLDQGILFRDGFDGLTNTQ